MIYCSKCKTRITTHLWIVRDNIFCSPSCERGGKTQFESLYKAFRQAKNAKPHPDIRKK